MQIIYQWAGGRGQGLDDIAAKIQRSKHQSKFPGAVVSVEDAGWRLSNGKPARKVVVRADTQTGCSITHIGHGIGPPRVSQRKVRAR